MLSHPEESVCLESMELDNDIHISCVGCWGKGLQLFFVLQSSM